MASASNFPFADVSDEVLLNLCNCNTVPPLSYLSNLNFQPIVAGDIYDGPFNPDNNLTTYREDFKCEYFTSAEIMKVMNLKKSLSFLTHNISSIPSNIDEFFVDFEGVNIDVLGLCETRLSDSIESIYQIAGYDMHSNSRNTNGGGTALYIKEEFHSRNIPSLAVMSSYVESIFASFRLDNVSFLVGNLYRPPNSELNEFISYIEDLLCLISREFVGFSVFLMGDFNLNLLKMNSNRKCFEFYTTLTSHGYHPAILKPTRVTATSQTLIDNIFCNNISQITQSGIVTNSISDHFPVFLNQQLENSAENRKSIYRIRLKNRECHVKFRNLLSSANWNSVYSTSDVEIMYEAFSDELFTMYNESFPVIQREAKPIDMCKPYIDNNLRELIRQKHKLEKKFRRQPITYKNEYHKLRNKVNKLVYKAKQNYFAKRSAECKGNSRKSWNLVSDVLGRGRKPTVIKQMTDPISDVTLTKDKDIADCLNNYFANVGSSFDSQFNDDDTFENYLPPANSSILFSFEMVDAPYLERIIRSIKEASPGYDEIPISVFRENFQMMSEVMVRICNLSLQQGIFPNSLKRAKVIPIFKSDERSCPKNYRPISILCSFAKILEKVVYTQLEQYFICNNLFTRHQFGFRRGMSTDNAINTLLSIVYPAFDRGEYALSIFLDLTKAFDLVDRRILLRKLYLYGIMFNENSWLESYLTGRMQCCAINGVESTLKLVERGVPQGSILGPLLFLVFINDLSRSTSFFNFVMYADDTSLVVTSKKLSELVLQANHEIVKVTAWFSSNKLMINERKTKYMIAHRQARKVPVNIPSFLINNVCVERVFQFKFLGVVVDSCLKFKQHVEFIVRKTSKYVPILYKLKKILHRNILLQIYLGLVLPNINYCVSVWGASYGNVLKPLQSMQYKVFKAIFSPDVPIRNALDLHSMSLLTLDEIYFLSVCNYVYKSRERNDDSFHFSTCPYPTRQTVTGSLYVPFTNSVQTSKSILISGPRLYNSLPSNVKGKSSYVSFKYAVKQLLLSSS